MGDDLAWGDDLFRDTGRDRTELMFIYGSRRVRTWRISSRDDSSHSARANISIRYGMFARAVVRFTDRKPSPRAVGLEGWAFGQ